MEAKAFFWLHILQLDGLKMPVLAYSANMDTDHRITDIMTLIKNDPIPTSSGIKK